MLISILLLLIYSLGFSHNIIPHQHGVEIEIHEHSHEKNEHSHHHHNSAKKIKTEHQHVAHGNHFDESLYDLLICFLHESHQDDDCVTQYYISAKTNRTNINKLQVNKFITILFSIILENEDRLATGYQIYSNIDYHSQAIEVTSPRGPPKIS